MSRNQQEIIISNVRAFLHSEELRGRLSVVSTSNNLNSRKLNFNLHKESSKCKVDFKNKNKKDKIRAISYEFILIPKKKYFKHSKKRKCFMGTVDRSKTVTKNHIYSRHELETTPFEPDLCESSSSDSSDESFLSVEEVMPSGSPSGSLHELMKNFRYNLQNQYVNGSTAKKLLQRPSIELVLEDVTDTGGVFRQVTLMFWRKIHECELYFIDGLIDDSSECHALEKLLFCIADEWRNNRDVIINIKVLNKKEAAAYIAEYEIITIRKKALDEFRLGFDRFDIVNELKNYDYNNLVRELYYKINYEIVIDQFDTEYINYQA
ncbi:hypothetical protein GLOIN_2v1885837 [Rhizophagus clarus]|uniref:Uncharacterized protein n=1 Tax=Rhizophagus clarus TaxID=94130 RepID=A0A8H3L870_9GLOM|nr:hypothetical protein GLOIN_2v1885837 [Rhizophagus clarus]